MKRLSKLFGSRDPEKTTTVDARVIYEVMEQIDEATKKIFECDILDLLNEPIGNIVPAIWCAPTDQSQLTSIQRQIQCTIYPMIRKISDVLKTEELAEVKDLTVDYLIKKLAIIELAFMIQSYKLNMVILGKSHAMDMYNLADTNVAGHA